MIRVTADQILREKLGNFMEAVEVCDEKGDVIGYYSPLLTSDRALYEEAEVPFSEEEIQGFLKQKTGRPLADILADLEKRS